MEEAGLLRKGPWLEEEDELLAAVVAVLGDRRWDALAKSSGLRRSGKSCRLRWMNYLRPNLKHGNISAEEERIIIELHAKLGNRWSKIAQRLPGRTDNEIKNYWRSYLKKKALVVDDECLSCTVDTSDGNNSINNESGLVKDDISGTSDDSFDPLDLLCLTDSPYETRLTEWMVNWAPDIRKMDPKDMFCNYDLYSPESISGDCTWDISLWDGE